jgi:hypothetical protein
MLSHLNNLVIEKTQSKGAGALIGSIGISENIWSTIFDIRREDR